MWFRKLLSRILRRDFTARFPTAAEQAEMDRIEAEHANDPQPQGWTSDCTWGEKLSIEAVPGGVHRCCDGAISALSCSQRRYACVGHYGVCCSKC